MDLDLFKCLNPQLINVADLLSTSTYCSQRNLHVCLVLLEQRSKVKLFFTVD